MIQVDPPHLSPMKNGEKQQVRITTTDADTDHVHVRLVSMHSSLSPTVSLHESTLHMLRDDGGGRSEQVTIYASRSCQPVLIVEFPTSGQFETIMVGSREMMAGAKLEAPATSDHITTTEGESVGIVLVEEDEEDEEYVPSSTARRTRALQVGVGIVMLVTVFFIVKGVAEIYTQHEDQVIELDPSVINIQPPDVTPDPGLILPPPGVNEPPDVVSLSPPTVCTNFKIVDLKKGPDAQGCVNVKCEQGHTQLMRWTETTWADCP